MPARTGQQRVALDQTAAHVRAAAADVELDLRAELFADPGVALGRQRRAGRPDDPQPQVQRGQVEAGRPAGHQETRARAHHGGAGLLGQPPLPAEVGERRVAVDQHHRGADQQGGGQGVPHHPRGGGVPEQRVAAAEVPGQGVVLQVLEHDAAVAVHDRLRLAGGPGGEEHDQRVVERHRDDVGPALGHRVERSPPRPPTSGTRQSPYSMSRTCRTVGRAARTAATSSRRSMSLRP